LHLFAGQSDGLERGVYFLASALGDQDEFLQGVSDNVRVSCASLETLRHAAGRIGCGNSHLPEDGAVLVERIRNVVCTRPHHLESPRHHVQSGLRVWGQTRFRSEEHTSELQSRENLVCRLLLEKKKQRI